MMKIIRASAGGIWRCDARFVHYIEDPDGPSAVYTPYGERVYGHIYGVPVEGSEIGYILHGHGDRCAHVAAVERKNRLDAARSESAIRRAREHYAKAAAQKPAAVKKVATPPEPPPVGTVPWRVDPASADVDFGEQMGMFASAEPAGEYDSEYEFER